MKGIVTDIMIAAVGVAIGVALGMTLYNATPLKNLGKAV